MKDPKTKGSKATFSEITYKRRICLNSIQLQIIKLELSE